MNASWRTRYCHHRDCLYVEARFLRRDGTPDSIGWRLEPRTIGRLSGPPEGDWFAPLPERDFRRLSRSLRSAWAAR